MTEATLPGTRRWTLLLAGHWPLHSLKKTAGPRAQQTERRSRRHCRERFGSWRRQVDDPFTRRDEGPWRKHGAQPWRGMPGADQRLAGACSTGVATHKEGRLVGIWGDRLGRSDWQGDDVYRVWCCFGELRLAFTEKDDETCRAGPGSSGLRQLVGCVWEGSCGVLGTVPAVPTGGQARRMSLPGHGRSGKTWPLHSKRRRNAGGALLESWRTDDPAGRRQAAGLAPTRQQMR